MSARGEQAMPIPVMTDRHPRTWLAAALIGVGLACLPDEAVAADLVTALPYEFALGASRGYAVAPDVDTAASRHALALPEPDRAHVTWQRQIPGGVAANLLVDADGRIFAAGPGRVTQLAADGALQFSHLAAFSSPVSAALLADGSRAVLTREGRVRAWSATGASVLDVALEAPSPSGGSALLPLADGGALASVGQWLFEIDAARSVRSYARLPAGIQQTLLVDDTVIVADEQGRVFEWDRRELPRAIGSFGSPVSALAADAGALIGLCLRRNVLRLDRSDGSLRELVRLDPPGAAPVLARIEPARWVLMKLDGSWFTLDAGTPAAPSTQRSFADAPNHVELLADARGRVAWWATDVPLHLETAPGVGRELAAVHCTTPVSLVPAGRSSIAAACSSGTIWLIGPEAPREP